MERSSRLEELKIQLPEPIGGQSELSAVLGIPEWWPTGSRIAIVLAHGADSDLNHPLIRWLHSELTQHKVLSLRFNFPFAEAGKGRKVDSPETLQRAYRAAISVLGRDPAATPAHLFLAGVGLGGQVAASLAADLLPIKGVCLMGYPLQSPGAPEAFESEALYRIVSPMLFIQGAHDPSCDVRRLSKALGRVGAPTEMHVSDLLGAGLEPIEDSPDHQEAAFAEVFGALTSWVAALMRED